MSTLLSIVALSVVAALCTVAIFNSHYQDSWSERVGLSGIAIWCVARVVYKFQHEPVTDPVHLFLHIGLLIFAVGNAVQRYRHYHQSLAQSNLQSIQQNSGAPNA